MIHLIKMKSRFWSWKLRRSALLSLKSCSTGAKKAALSGKHESCLYTLALWDQGSGSPGAPMFQKITQQKCPVGCPWGRLKKKKKKRWKIPEQRCIVKENLIKCTQGSTASCVFWLQRCSSYTQDWHNKTILILTRVWNVSTPVGQLNRLLLQTTDVLEPYCLLCL